jgi:redox-sensitive bicupin YhaK (pirin superfamily)
VKSAWLEKKPMSERRLIAIAQGTPASDGAGVKLLRVIGTQELDHIDPFLLLDEFRNEDSKDYVAGFPDHPHRGFETVTYMIQGRMRHKDSVGNSGLLTDGALQWMTAGRGIIHSEMPEQTDGLIWGYQLWVNLPARDKMTAPRYQDIPPEAIPVTEAGGAAVKVLAGEWNGVKGAADTLWPIEYLDVTLEPGAEFAKEVPEGHSLLAFVYRGALLAESEEGEHEIAQRHLGLFTREGAGLTLKAGNEGAGFLLLSGQPIGEPVARMGPFVMNSREELMQAVQDYQAGRLAT